MYFYSLCFLNSSFNLSFSLLPFTSFSFCPSLLLLRKEMFFSFQGSLSSIENTVTSCFKSQNFYKFFFIFTEATSLTRLQVCPLEAQICHPVTVISSALFIRFVKHLLCNIKKLDQTSKLAHRSFCCTLETKLTLCLKVFL